MGQSQRGRMTLLALAGASAVYGGCAVGPNYKAPTVEVLPGYGNAGAEYSAAHLQGATRPSMVTSQGQPVSEWWRTFNDDKLEALAHRAMSDNLDLQRATERVREARATRAVQVGGYYPKIDANGSYSHVRTSENGVASAFGGGGGAINPGDGGSTPPGSGGTPAIPGGSLGEFDLYQGSFDASYEVDLFGRVRRGVEAADADLEAALEDRRDVMVTLLGDVARGYIELRILQRRLELSKSNLEAQQRIARITADRQKQGLVNRLDVDRAGAQVATTLASIPELEQNIATTIHRLSVLVGERPAALAAELQIPRAMPPVPDEVPIGLPADLIRRRPDIRKAERQIAAATARIGVATADLYPRVTLNGSLGLQSVEPGDLLDYRSRFYSLGPSVSIPIFEGGRLRATVKVYESREKQAALTFHQTVLTAWREVEDALVNYSKTQERVASLRDAVTSNRKAADVALELYGQGLGDFLNVLDAQRSLYSAEDTLAQGEGAVDTALVALYKALGGGWEVSPMEDKPQPVRSAMPVTSMAKQ